MSQFSKNKIKMLPRSSPAQMEGCAEEDGDAHIHSEVKRSSIFSFLFSLLSASVPLCLRPHRPGWVGPARLADFAGGDRFACWRVPQTAGPLPKSAVSFAI